MYDYVFAEDSTQDEVYQTTTSPLIKDVLKGYSAAVFAYGATGSGKFKNEHFKIERTATAAAKLYRSLTRFQVKLIRCSVQIHEKGSAHRNHHQWNFRQRRRCQFKHNRLKVV